MESPDSFKIVHYLFVYYLDMSVYNNVLDTSFPGIHSGMTIVLFMILYFSSYHDCL